MAGFDWLKGIGAGGAAGTYGMGGKTGKFLWGSDEEMEQLPTMTKEQSGLLSQLLQMLGQGGGIGQGMQEGVDLQRQFMDPNSEAVRQFTDPYMRQFEQETVPGLAERFSGFGGGMGGGLSSSGFGQALGSAGGNLQSQLAQLKAGLGQKAAQSLMDQYGTLSGQGLGAQSFGYWNKQPTQGLFPGLLQAGAQAYGKSLGGGM